MGDMADEMEERALVEWSDHDNAELASVVDDMPISHKRPVPAMGRYGGISTSYFTPEQIAQLPEDIPDEEIEVRPDGLVYLPEMKYRRILNKAFGPGAWAILPIDISIKDNFVFYRGQLWIHGNYIAESTGSQEYFPDNGKMDYSTAAEAAKSNCLVRCCKDLGIAANLWDRRFTRQWIAKYAVQVFVQHAQDSGKRKAMWRRKDEPAIDVWPWKETGLVGGGNSQPAPAEKRQQQPSAQREPQYISDAQVHRLNRIIASAQWSHEQVNELLFEYGFTSALDITKDKYNDICDVIEKGSQRKTLDGMKDADKAAIDRERLSAFQPNKGKLTGYVISEKQAKRFHAIASANGWTMEERTTLLTLYGYDDAAEIDRGDYEALTGNEQKNIMGELQDPETLAFIRG